MIVIIVWCMVLQSYEIFLQSQLMMESTGSTHYQQSYQGISSFGIFITHSIVICFIRFYRDRHLGTSLMFNFPMLHQQPLQHQQQLLLQAFTRDKERLQLLIAWNRTTAFRTDSNLTILPSLVHYYELPIADFKMMMDVSY